MSSWELLLIPYPTLPVDREYLERLRALTPGLRYPAIALGLDNLTPELSQGEISSLDRRVQACFQGWVFGAAPQAWRSQITSFFSKGKKDLKIVGLREDLDPLEKGFLVEFLWNLKVRRLQWLKEHPEELVPWLLTPLDLNELDELYEIEAYTLRGRVERGEPLHLSLLFLVLSGG